MKKHRNIKKMTTTFKEIRFQNQNCQEGQIENKQFNQTLIKSNAIEKITAMAFQTNLNDRKSIVQGLLHDYQNSQYFKSALDPHHSADSINNHLVDSINKYPQNNNNLQVSEDQQEQNGAYKKSKVLILELQNKKLKLKQKMLTKKYRQSKLMQKQQKNQQDNKRQKKLLRQELTLLQDIRIIKKQINSFKIQKKNNIQNILKQNVNQSQKGKQEQKKLALKEVQEQKEYFRAQKSKKFLSNFQQGLNANTICTVEDLMHNFQDFLNIVGHFNSC